MKMTSCYMCANLALDYGVDCYNLCNQCSRLVYADAGLQDYFNELHPDGTGFEKNHPNNWESNINNIIGRICSANGMTRKKSKYIDKCPCGLHPSQCVYHR